MRSVWLKLALLQAIGNAALLWLGYAWLGIGEANAGMVTLSVIAVIAFLAGGALLHGTSLAYFREPRNSLRRTMLAVVRRLPKLMLVAIVAVGLYIGLWMWDPKPLVLWIASGLTLFTQSPVRPAWILRVIEIAVMILRWWVLPVLLIAWASGAAARGWRYWLLVPVTLGVGVWLPLWLVSWTPIRGTFSSEFTSFLLRYAAAYLLFIGACLVLAFATSRGRPALSHESTTASV